MNRLLALIAGLCISLQAHATVEQSILPSMETIYTQEFGKKVNKGQKERMQLALQKQAEKLRFMTYNMLYNAQDAEEKLKPNLRWEARKPRLFEYLAYAKPDVIGSQELQEDQIEEVMAAIGDSYGYYGEKTRQNEGRTDTNAIFFNKARVELLESVTVPYKDDQFENAFTYCLFQDKFTQKKFVVLNTKLSWGSPDRRLAEAVQLNEFSTRFGNEPVVVLGDFNLYPFMLHKRNLFLDGEDVELALKGSNLKDAKSKSAFGYFGPLVSINNSKETLEPFIGPELVGFVLDLILVNDQVEVLTQGIDPAKVNGEFPSDHFPVIADLAFR